MNKMDKKDTVAADTIPDNEVIARVLQGEKNLYAVIVRRYNQRLYRVGMSMINNDDDVEDIMQVTYIKAYENLGKFAFKSAFPTWLTRILINECLLHLKKGKKSINMNDDMMNNEKYRQHPDNGQSPVGKILNSELKGILEHAIRQLPEKYRTVFIMREVEDMNIAETKECLHISEVNVKVRLNRAKNLLRDSLHTYYKKEDILHFHLTRCDKIVEQVMKKISLL